MHSSVSDTTQNIINYKQTHQPVEDIQNVNAARLVDDIEQFGKHWIRRARHKLLYKNDSIPASQPTRKLHKKLKDG